jgi:hypothetical protein
MSAGTWKDRLLAASVRVAEYGVTDDVSSLSTPELWVIHKLMSRRAGDVQGVRYVPKTGVAASRRRHGGGL